MWIGFLTPFLNLWPCLVPLKQVLSFPVFCGTYLVKNLIEFVFGLIFIFNSQKNVRMEIEYENNLLAFLF